MARHDEDKIRLSPLAPVKIVGSFEVCIDKCGAVQRVTMLEPTGLPHDDGKITRTIRAFRYEPVVIGAQARDACTG